MMMVVNFNGTAHEAILFTIFPPLMDVRCSISHIHMLTELKLLIYKKKCHFPSHLLKFSQKPFFFIQRLIMVVPWSWCINCTIYFIIKDVDKLLYLYNTCNLLATRFSCLGNSGHIPLSFLTVCLKGSFELVMLLFHLSDHVSRTPPLSPGEMTSDLCSFTHHIISADMWAWQQVPLPLLSNLWPCCYE